MIVRSGHGKHIIVGIVGFLRGVYFPWQHKWIWATAVLSAVLGSLPASGTTEETPAQTLLGKITLLHLHFVNLASAHFRFLRRKVPEVTASSSAARRSSRKQQ